MRAKHIHIALLASGIAALAPVAEAEIVGLAGIIVVSRHKKG